MPRKKKSETTEEIKKPKTIGPFDIIKMMFTDKTAFDNLTDAFLAKNFFMINRVMSIQFPLQAQCFNRLNINVAQVIRSWQLYAASQCGYGRVPSFVYTKSGKSIMVDNDNIDKDVKIAYCLHFNITESDLNDMLYFYHDATLEHINYYKENIYSQKNSIEKQKI